MSTRAKAKEIIRILEKRGFYAECPCCGEPVKLRDCGLFYLDDFTPGAREAYEALQMELRETAAELKKRRRTISIQSEVGARSVNLGFILERLAPSMSTFRFNKNDCRSLFDPIDYLIFEGLSTKGVVTRIFFTEIKTGGSLLKPRQKDIRSLVESKKVSLLTYRTENRK